MHTRKHLSQRYHMSLIIAGGLFFCITLALPPSLQAAHAERMGMIESTDHGATWQFKGHADFHSPSLNPVDPSALYDKGLLAFYFFDLMSLGTDTAVAYRSVATDSVGLDFTPPAPAFKFAGDFTDPFVLKLPDGRYRMYIHGPTAILSATSDDGFAFDQDPGERTRAGGKSRTRRSASGRECRRLKLDAWIDVSGDGQRSDTSRIARWTDADILCGLRE